LTDEDDRTFALINAKMPINPNGGGPVYSG